MRSRAFLAFTAALLLAAPAAAQPSPDLVAAAVRRDLTRYAASGAAVALIAGDSTVLLRGFGSVGHGDDAAPVTADMPFGTVRLHDVLTALLAVRLDELDRLDLDAPIGAYAADLPPRVGSVTLRQLLSHTAGLDDAPDIPSRRRTASRTWPGATDGALFTDPGAIHSYSRHSYPLARAIIAARTGRAESELLEELVLAPAGMHDATVDAEAAARRGAVPGYVVSTSSAQPLVALDPAANPMPQLYASARDLGALLRAWLRSAGSPPTGGIPTTTFRTAAAAIGPVPARAPDSVALGWTLSRARGVRTLSYEDGEAGYGVIVRVMPEAGIGIAIVANATGAGLTRVADAALALVLPRDSTTPATPPADAPSEAAPATLAGTYANGDRIIVLEARRDSLVWRDGALALPVRRRGARLEAVVGDGRVAQAFDIHRDARGTAYLIVEGRAYRRQPARVR